MSISLEAEECHERDGYGASWFALGKGQVGCHAIKVFPVNASGVVSSSCRAICSCCRTTDGCTSNYLLWMMLQVMKVRIEGGWP